ncbi:MAG: hypothetical protein IJ437_02740 [Clostridia bacterium]|nr:hypothetical protein [Clostridia bacterium]
MTKPSPALEERINTFVNVLFLIELEESSFNSLAPVTKPETFPKTIIGKHILQMPKILNTFLKKLEKPIFIGIYDIKMLEISIKGNSVGISVLKQKNNEVIILFLTNSAFVKNNKIIKSKAKNMVIFFNFVIIVFSSS